MQVKITDSNGRAVTETWVVRQAFPNATVTDQAHRAFGVWNVPAGTPAGSIEVVVDPPFLGRAAQKDTIRWAQFQHVRHERHA